MKKLSLVLLVVLGGCGPDVYVVSGPVGKPGANGHNSLVALVAGAPSCSNGGTTLLSGLDSNDSAVLDAGEVTFSADLCNGNDGAVGQDAPPTQFTPTGLVNPCGDAPGIYDEVFIKLANGTLIASFSDNANGNNTRFSVLTTGTYQTTDGDGCTFSVDGSGNITNESHQF